MKRIYAKSCLVAGGYLIGSCIFLLLLILPEDKEMIILLVLVYLYIGIGLGGLWINFKYHRIEYGEGKLILYRISKDVKEKRPVGKWKIREDQIEVKDLLRYGYARDIIGSCLEWDKFTFSGYANVWRFENQIVFMTKDHKMASISPKFFTSKQIKEVIRYIYRETGILPEGTFRKCWGIDKFLGIENNVKGKL